MNPANDERTHEVTPRARRARSKLTLILPPPAFALPLAIGLLVGRWTALPIAHASSQGMVRALGIALLGVGLGLLVSCLVMFIRRRTTVIPHGRATTLVTSGPYRLTRNPMYVSLTLIYVGVAAFANVLWPLLLLPGPLLLVGLVHIPFEERTLSEAFGEEYRRYGSRVRRWL